MGPPPAQAQPSPYWRDDSKSRTAESGHGRTGAPARCEHCDVALVDPHARSCLDREETRRSGRQLVDRRALRLAVSPPRIRTERLELTAPAPEYAGTHRLVPPFRATPHTGPAPSAPMRTGVACQTTSCRPRGGSTRPVPRHTTTRPPPATQATNEKRPPPVNAVEYIYGVARRGKWGRVRGARGTTGLATAPSLLM